MKPTPGKNLPFQELLEDMHTLIQILLMSNQELSGIKFSPRLKEALSAMLVAALETRNADVANRLMGMGAVLDDHARSHFLGPLGDGGWHALFFESSPEIVALTDRLMDAYPRLKSGTILARMLLAAFNAQASATAARLLDLVAVLDRNALATVL